VSNSDWLECKLGWSVNNLDWLVMVQWSVNNSDWLVTLPTLVTTVNNLDWLEIRHLSDRH